MVTNHPTHTGVAPLERKRIETWVNKRFFSVTAPNGGGQLLFAPSAATVLKYPDVGDDLTDYTRHLVTVVPKGANVRVTTAQPVADDAGDGSHFADHDLRRDILIHCHDNREHPSLAETSRDVRALIWFPKMQSYIDYHYNSCSYCVAKRTAADPVGTAIRG